MVCAMSVSFKPVFVRCPQCETELTIPWAEINRRSQVRECTKCDGLLLIRAEIKLEVLKLREPKPGEV